MPYVIFDDGYPDHPKIEALSDAAFRLHSTAIINAGRLLTDGLILEARVPRLVPGYRPKTLAELVDAGLVHRPGHDCPSPQCGPVPDGHVLIHDYLDVQRSKEQVLRDREAAAARQRRRRGVSHGVTPPVTNGVSHTTQSDPIQPEGIGSVGSNGAQPILDPPEPPRITDEARALEVAGIAQAKQALRQRATG